ncbi:hypothetical protein KO489_09915 [Reinekea forsetii]|nr:hypothetical protein [Reinekea forsetii]
MKRFLFLLVTAFFSLLGTLSAEENRYDLEVLRQFKTYTTQLENAVTSQCETESGVNFTQLWTETASQWFLIKGLGLPALEFLQLDHQVVFWPDSKDRLRKQVNNALTSQLSSTQLDALPNSVMSLSAIEYIQTLTPSDEHCQWQAAIMKKQTGLAIELFDLQQYYEFSTFEQVTALHSSVLLSHSLLKEVLSNSAKVNWALAPGWRSQSGWPILQALSAQINTLFKQLDPDSDQRARTELLLKQVIDSEAPLTQSELADLNQQLKMLAHYIENDLALSLDIYLGFNNFDGD